MDRLKPPGLCEQNEYEIERNKLKELDEVDEYLLEVHGVAPGKKGEGITRAIYHENGNGINNRMTGNEKQEDPPFLEKGDSAEVEFSPQQLIYLESFDSCPGMGRVAVMDSNQLVMLGKVMSVKYKPYKKR